MNKCNKNFTIIFLLIIGVFICNTLVYCAINSTMTVTGLAYTRMSKDIRITKFYINETSSNTISLYEEFNKESIKTNITLPNKDSYISYKLEITNYASPAGIYEIKNLPNNLKYEIINYTLKEPVCVNDKCSNGVKKDIILKISYNTFNSSNTSFDLNLDLVFKKVHEITYENMSYNYDKYVMDGETLTVNYSNGPKYIKVYNGSNPLNRNLYSCNNKVLTIPNVKTNLIVKPYELIKVTKGNGINIGDMLKIENEGFYVIDSTDRDVTLFSEYNLYVGGVFDHTTNKYEPKYWKPYPKGELTNLQRSDMIANDSSTNLWQGTTAYSDEEHHGVEYSSYKGSLMELYVNRYKDILESYGVKINESRLITKDELIKPNLGCTIYSNQEFGDCENARPWVYKTSFWTQSAVTPTFMWSVNTNRAFYITKDYANPHRGVRPVIKIPRDAFKLQATTVTGDGTKVGDEIRIGTEHFNVIKDATNTDTITMLAKYSLHAGGYFDSTSGSWDMVNWHPYGNAATNKQDEEMRGLSDHGPLWKGTSQFSNNTQHGVKPNSYEGSLVKIYVDKYKDILEKEGFEIVEARLMKKTEFESLGCIESQYMCSNSPSWLLGRTFWGMDGRDNDSVYGMDYTGRFEAYNYHGPSVGIRPVITIKKSTLNVTKPIKVKDGGSGNKISSYLSLGDEEFIVIKETPRENTVTAISKYNLHVGGIYQYVEGDWGNPAKWTPYGNYATNIQREDQKASLQNDYTWRGTTKFSEDACKGPTYSSYQGSLVEKYVNNYKTILEKNYVPIIEARLLRKEEALNLGCVIHNSGTKQDGSCRDSIYPWLTASTYWTESTFDEKNLWGVISDGLFTARRFDLFSRGVRPVIVVDKKYIDY